MVNRLIGYRSSDVQGDATKKDIRQCDVNDFLNVSLIDQHERQGIIEIKLKKKQIRKCTQYMLEIAITLKINNPIPKIQTVSFVSSSRRDVSVVTWKLTRYTQA